MASRILLVEDLQEETYVKSHLIAKDGIAIIVSPGNQVNNLTKEQVRNIFSGKITNWIEVGGKNREIHVATREIGSGTAASFEYFMMSGEPVTKYAILEPSSGALRQVVSDEQAIAFLSFGYLDEKTKAVSLDEVSATNANIINGSYPLVRPFYLMTRGEPAGEVKEFIDFCQGPEGQSIVEAEGYLKIY
jgi:phosphate transport system substrate-binding protein